VATRHKFRCPECGEETRKSALFGAVKAVADHSEPACPRCGASTALQLSFDFALDVQHKDAKVLASFYPNRLEEWPCEGRTVTFYPFLIVTKREGRDQAVWLPYWHVVRDGEKENLKYGQWAPFMDMELFEDLLSRARNAGFLNHEA
jgi:predicted RNA-binding Zn-ribbon protein involved in translation (DUF1610 family)